MMDFQEYVIENDYLKVTITSWGAQVKSVVRKLDGVEHIWQADSSVWGYHAPILFPHTGKVVNNTIHAKGKDYSSGQHGFARILEHDLVRKSATRVDLELRSNPETLANFPYEFRLVSTFSLDGDTLHHTLTVQNRDTEVLPFGIGFHPAFAIPFDTNHTYSDYELRFDKMESPLCLSCQPNGLVRGKCYYLGTNIDTIPIDNQLFAIDSHCMTNLNSSTLGIYEKDSGRAVVCSIKNFPYTLIWSKPGEPKFVCIEPWHSLPSAEKSSTDWTEKPAAAILAPGQKWSTTLSTRFVR